MNYRLVPTALEDNKVNGTSQIVDNFQFSLGKNEFTLGGKNC